MPAGVYDNEGGSKGARLSEFPLCSMDWQTLACIYFVLPRLKALTVSNIIKAKDYCSVVERTASQRVCGGLFLFFFALFGDITGLHVGHVCDARMAGTVRNKIYIHSLVRQCWSLVQHIIGCKSSDISVAFRCPHSRMSFIRMFKFQRMLVLPAIPCACLRVIHINDTRFYLASTYVCTANQTRHHRVSNGGVNTSIRMFRTMFTQDVFCTDCLCRAKWFAKPISSKWCGKANTIVFGPLCAGQGRASKCSFFFVTFVFY